MVRDALKVMKPTLDKVKGMVEFFHKSTRSTEKLKSTQRQMDMPELRLKQDCVTRWNSTLYMLKRVLESKDAIISTLALINAHMDALDQEEWEARQETCTVLEPFEQVTVEISSERGLQKITAYNQTQVTKRKVTELVTALSTSMDRKFHRMEYNTVLSESTVLDPRFKRLAFNDNCAVDEALQRVTAAAARCDLSSQPAQPPGGQEGEEGARAPEVEPQMSAVWRLFDARATEDIARRNPSADAMLEVRSYLEEPLIPRTADPLSWADNNREKKPDQPL
ncbi:zinc finger BED domain-containing protein 4-like [Trematomus bernacchii]|uniref:zinc finger BED domain-containing protein 4-like n=1 Tax=Trematomus bernacchii TaxID=40690 RepID=UPI00146BC649|nr:zinc finger BED domain-containing protein 4-like [Trematomus bernacchii]